MEHSVENSIRQYHLMPSSMTSTASINNENTQADDEVLSSHIPDASNPAVPSDNHAKEPSQTEFMPDNPEENDLNNLPAMNHHDESIELDRDWPPPGMRMDPHHY